MVKPIFKRAPKAAPLYQRTTPMAKDKERQLAEIYYTVQGLTAKKIASLINVAEKTIGDWVDKYNWKDLRTAKQTSPDKLIAGYNALLQKLLDKRLEIEDGNREEKEFKGIIDEISKISAAIDRIQKTGRPTLRVYIYCITSFMDALQNENPKLFMELLDFQEKHILKKAEELK